MLSIRQTPCLPGFVIRTLHAISGSEKDIAKSQFDEIILGTPDNLKCWVGGSWRVFTETKYGRVTYDISKVNSVYNNTYQTVTPQSLKTLYICKY